MRSLIRFVKLLFRPASAYPRRPKAPDSLARTLKDSTHVRGGDGGMMRASTEQQHKVVAEGHENYTKSFKKKPR